MEIQKCGRCGVNLTGYDLAKAKIEQKLKSEVNGIYCKNCLPVILQKQKFEKARQEVNKLSNNSVEKKRYNDIITKK